MVWPPRPSSQNAPLICYSQLWKRLKGKNPEGKHFRKLLRRKQSSAKISKISRNTLKSSKSEIFYLLSILLKVCEHAFLPRSFQMFLAFAFLPSGSFRSLFMAHFRALSNHGGHSRLLGWAAEVQAWQARWSAWHDKVQSPPNIKCRAQLLHLKANGSGRLIFIHLQCWEVLPFCRFQRQRCIKIRVLRAQHFYTPLALKTAKGQHLPALEVYKNQSPRIYRHNIRNYYLSNSKKSFQQQHARRSAGMR